MHFPASIFENQNIFMIPKRFLDAKSIFEYNFFVAHQFCHSKAIIHTNNCIHLCSYFMTHIKKFTFDFVDSSAKSFCFFISSKAFFKVISSIIATLPLLKSQIYKLV